MPENKSPKTKDRGVLATCRLSCHLGTWPALSLGCNPLTAPGEGTANRVIGAGVMSIFARSYTSFAAHSFETGVDLARKIRDGFAGQRLEAVIAYATVSHDQNAFLSGIREIAGPNVPVIGCSGQGVMGRGDVTEEGYVAGAMGLG